MSGFSSETFFRPPALKQERLNIPAVLFNRCRLLVNRCPTNHVFVPIRSMQFQAVMDRDEIIFVDHQGGYAVQDGEGGRLIVLAWQFHPEQPRESLNQPVAVDLVYYDQDSRALHQRLMSEFPPALDRFESLHAQAEHDPRLKRVVPFSQPE